MQRSAAPGDFRANLHRGGSGEAVELDAAERHMAVRAAAAMGLQMAGVDLLRSARGPLLLEVNASPGLEGIETCTGVDLADAIVAHCERFAKVPRPSRLRRRGYRPPAQKINDRLNFACQ
jgi:ribosomal protein S6--L-glutamate ligase